MSSRNTQILNELTLAEDSIRALTRQIYDAPEISDQEYKASSLCKDLLAERGFSVEGVDGIETAFVAELRGRQAGPTIAILAEYDALPEIGHGCGHHLIAGSAVGAGVALSKVMRDLPGTIKVVGCPAEETGKGKPALLAAGAFEGVDLALTFHAYEATSIMTSCTGVKVFDFEFQGKASHVATDPWEGASALDGVLLTYQNINALRQFVRDGVRIHGIITHGGDAFNVVPERASCRLGVRSSDTAELDRVAERVLDCARAAALASGTDLSVSEVTHLEPVRYNAELADRMRSILENLGETVTDWPALASTDFGNVSQAVPSLLFSVSTWPSDIAFHTRDAALAAGSAKAFDAMVTGAAAIALCTTDLLADTAGVASVKASFNEQQPQTGLTTRSGSR